MMRGWRQSLARQVQDYLIKGSMDGRTLLRAMHYAIERKRIESALRQSEAKNRALLEAVPDMLLSLDCKTACNSFQIPGVNSVQ
jgi:PAS domain-containing protein